MGYRSDVGLVLSKNIADKLRKTIKNISLTELTENNHHITESMIINNIKSILSSADTVYKDEKTGSEVYYWGWVKWYPESFRTIIIENILNDSDPDEYLYIVIGEEDDDIKIKGNYINNPFEMCLIRDIHITKPESKTVDNNDNEAEYEEKVRMNVDGTSATILDDVGNEIKTVRDIYDTDYSSVNYSIS